MLKDYKLKSIFKNEISYFIKYKQSLGNDYKNEISILKHLDKALVNLKNKKIDKTTFEKVTKRNDTPYKSYSRKYHVINEFFKYLVSNGYKNIYYKDKKFHIVNDYQPIIFNNQEISKLFETLDQYKKNSSDSFYKINYTYSIIFRLVYSCGLRISEALKIKIEDVIIDNKIINIYDTKKHASRIVVFSETMKLCLIKYIDFNKIKEGLLFVNKKGKQIKYHTIRHYYKKMLYLARLNVDARIHDLRHTFVNNALNQMLSKGYDENVVLIYLHKYLGHESIRETEYYLHFTDYNKNKLLEYNNTLSKKLYEGVDYNE